MKKLLKMLLVTCTCISMVACGNTATSNGAAENTDNAAEESQSVETVATESATTEVVETEPAETEASETETTEAETTETEAAQTETEETAAAESDTASTGNTLVVYFSCTGNTKAIAEHIAGGLDADLYEIVAAQPYTDADLDYGDNNSRSTLEMNDTSVRPAITGSVQNMEQYDTVYIGYPIWWGEAPRIVDTFVESYDFTDKTVIPFATSASSGMGSSASRLESLAGAGTWLAGQRFSGNESSSQVMEWVNQF